MLKNSKAFSGFAVGDLQAARQFYGETLGLDISVLQEDMLLSLDVGGDRDVLIYHKPDHAPATYTVLNFPVRDVDRAVDDLIASGIEMARFEGFDQDARGVARDGGPAIAWFRDPAGNILSVVADDTM